MHSNIRPTEVRAALKDGVSHYCETLALLLARAWPCMSLSVMLMVYDDLLFEGQSLSNAASMTVPQRKSNVCWAHARNEVWGLQPESQ